MQESIQKEVVANPYFFFTTRPDLNGLTDFSKFGSLKYKWESMCWFPVPVINAAVEMYFSRIFFYNNVVPLASF